MDDPNATRRRHPEQWVTGDEPMTAAQAAYLRTLCREAEEPFSEALTKAEASERIDALRRRTGRAAPAATETRRAEEVFAAHLARRAAGEVEEDLRENFDPQVVVLAADGAHRGHDGVRYLLLLLGERFPNATFTWRTTLVEGEVALLEWEVDGQAEGVDSYVIRGGRIVAMTMSFRGR